MKRAGLGRGAALVQGGGSEDISVVHFDFSPDSLFSLLYGRGRLVGAEAKYQNV